MSDSEGSVASPNGSEKSATCDETAETMPTRQDQNGDKPEEFEKLLQSMIITHSASEEEVEQVEEEDNAKEKKTVGRPVFTDCIAVKKLRLFVVTMLPNVSQSVNFIKINRTRFFYTLL